ncbi:MAG: ABC transporter permease [Oscillospiraceae bacterium]|nr:ABC transporter permease [Oscillospiraceae bacterium]
MKKYLSLLKVRFLNNLQYRAAAIGGLVTQFFWGIMLVYIFRAFYGNSSVSDGMSFQELVTFVWLQQGFLSFIFLYDWDYELLEMITTGGICYELIRPVNLYSVWYVKLLSKRVARGLLCFAPVILLGFLMPEPYTMSLPYDAVALLLFVVTLLLSLLLIVAISMLIFISIFVTLSPVGSISIFATIGEFFAGMTIPIPFMPIWLQKVCMFLPFRYTADLPLRVYSGNIRAGDAVVGIAIQTVWIVGLVILGNLCMKRVTRLSMVQGG